MLGKGWWFSRCRSDIRRYEGRICVRSNTEEVQKMKNTEEAL